MLTYKYPNPLQFLTWGVAGLPTDAVFKAVSADMRGTDMEYHISQHRVCCHADALKSAIEQLQHYSMPTVLATLILMLHKAFDALATANEVYLVDRLVFDKNPTMPYTIHIRVRKSDDPEVGVVYTVCWFVVRVGAITEAIANSVTAYVQDADTALIPSAFSAYVFKANVDEMYFRLCRYFAGLPTAHGQHLKTEEYDELIEQLDDVLSFASEANVPACWQALIRNSTEVAERTAAVYETLDRDEMSSYCYGFDDDSYLVVGYPHEQGLDVFLWHSKDASVFKRYVDSLGEPMVH